MITCTGCGQSLNPDQFAFKNKTTGRRHSRCRTCVSTYNREHHAANKSTINPRTAKRARNHKKEVRMKVHAYLRGRACTTCQTAKFPLIVLVDQDKTGGKRFSMLISNGWPWPKLKQLMETSPLLCQSCHGRKVAADVKAAAEASRAAGVADALQTSELEVAELQALPQQLGLEQGVAEHHVVAGGDTSATAMVDAA